MHDTHAHLELLLERLGLLEEGGLELSKEGGSYLTEHLRSHEFVIQPTLSHDNFVRVKSLFQSFPMVHYLYGAHPEIVDSEFNIEKYTKQVADYVRDDQSMIGFGEVGLDYYYTTDQAIIQKQKDLFRFYIQLSIEYQTPLVIHCRDAFEDLFAILDEYPEIHGNFLIHCFTGNTKELLEVQKRNGKVAYGGIVTFKNSKVLQQTLSSINPKDYVIETDLPFLAPYPNRGQVCVPEYIDDTAEKISELLGISKEKVWTASQFNSKQFFDIT